MLRFFGVSRKMLDEIVHTCGPWLLWIHGCRLTRLQHVGRPQLTWRCQLPTKIESWFRKRKPLLKHVVTGLLLWGRQRACCYTGRGLARQGACLCLEGHLESPMQKGLCRVKKGGKGDGPLFRHQPLALSWFSGISEVNSSNVGFVYGWVKPKVLSAENSMATGMLYYQVFFPDMFWLVRTNTLV